MAIFFHIIRSNFPNHFTFFLKQFVFLSKHKTISSYNHNIPGGVQYYKLRIACLVIKMNIENDNIGFQLGQQTQRNDVQTLI